MCGVGTDEYLSKVVCTMVEALSKLWMIVDNIECLLTCVSANVRIGSRGTDLVRRHLSVPPSAGSPDLRIIAS